jgi:hypothetical protein
VESFFDILGLLIGGVRPSTLAKSAWTSLHPLGL